MLLLFTGGVPAGAGIVVPALSIVLEAGVGGGGGAPPAVPIAPGVPPFVAVVDAIPAGERAPPYVPLVSVVALCAAVLLCEA
jgi:hypothetical protein